MFPVFHRLPAAHFLRFACYVNATLVSDRGRVTFTILSSRNLLISGSFRPQLTRQQAHHNAGPAATTGQRRIRAPTDATLGATDPLQSTRQVQ